MVVDWIHSRIKWTLFLINFVYETFLPKHFDGLKHFKWMGENVEFLSWNDDIYLNAFAYIKILWFQGQQMLQYEVHIAQWTQKTSDNVRQHFPNIFFDGIYILSGITEILCYSFQTVFIHLEFILNTLAVLTFMAIFIYEKCYCTILRLENRK